MFWETKSESTKIDLHNICVTMIIVWYKNIIEKRDELNEVILILIIIIIIIQQRTESIYGNFLHLIKYVTRLIV